MRHIMTFHPAWGCLAPARSFMRTVRAALVATAVGATTGGGVVSALVDHSAGDQKSVAERTLARLMPAAPTSVSAAQTAQPSTQKSDQREARLVLWADGYMKDPATNELNASSPARPMIAATSDEIRIATWSDPAKTVVAPSPTLQAREKRIAQRTHHKDALSSSRQPQHSLPPRVEPNGFQRFLAGLTVAIKRVWPLAASTNSPTSRAHRNSASAATT
jgi:hypothetical protein